MFSLTWRKAGITIDSMEMGKPDDGEEGISVHLVLYTKSATERTEIYDILMKTDKVMSVDFL